MNDPLICGCCEGISAQTPGSMDNRAGLASIAYRAGTWSQFKSTMLDALSTVPELAGLRTRGDDDFTIALIDAWAIVCDILTFYQERIANESYLRTATERVSIGELAKLVGYRLRPGTAASVALAFTIDAPVVLPPGPSNPPSGAPSEVEVAAGTKVQSVPEPGQQPATFETTSPIVARAEWNAIRPRLHFPPDGRFAHVNVRLAGLFGALQPGMSLLTIARDTPGQPAVQRIVKIEPDTATQTTLVRFESESPPVAAGSLSWTHPAPSGPLDDAFVSGNIKGFTWDQAELVAYARSQNWSIERLEDGINARRDTLAPGTAPPLRVFVLGTRAALFGHNAPQWKSLPDSMRTGAKPLFPNWEGFTLADDETFAGAAATTVDLDVPYPSIVAGTKVVLSAPGLAPMTANVVSSAEVSRTGYLLTGKVTEAVLDSARDDVKTFPLRKTQVLASTEELPVADVPWTDPIGGGSFPLDGAYLGLAVGQLVAVTGVRADKQDETASEVVTITGLGLIDGHTIIAFTPALSGTYVRASVTIDANVAPATHGESQSDILGSGDAGVAFQRFALAQSPLTYVSAQTPSGNASTLVVRVNGVRWDEVPWLYGRGPRERVYVTVVGAEGKTYVQFGDGVTGARPPSGTSNIVATYRRGSGRAGTVRAGQLSTLLSRPLGLKDVTNPLGSSGAGEPDSLDQARANAPVIIRTLDRIVTLEDFADFARAGAGIAKTRASWLWNGRDVACVTVAGAGGARVTPGTPQYDHLLGAMHDAGDGTVPVALCDFVPVTFTVAATVTIDPALVPAAVLAAVESALRRTFSFDARDFAQPVYRSEVIAAVQSVPGVVAMTLDAFRYSGTPAGAQPEALVAAAPQIGANGPVGAELLTLDGAPLQLVAVIA